MKNKMLLMLIVCVAMSATTFGDDFNGVTDITETTTSENVNLGVTSACTVNVKAGYWVIDGETLNFGVDYAATVNVEVGGILYSYSEIMMPADGQSVATRLNVYGGATQTPAQYEQIMSQLFAFHDTEMFHADHL